jgi:O-antigen/teichoic acid export membrane protein
MQILAGHIPLAAMDTVLAIALISSNRQGPYLWVSVAAAIFNPIACIILIRWADGRYGNGAIGAAIVTVATELVVLVGAMLLRSPGVLDRRSISHCLRIVAAGLCIVPVLLGFDSLPLALQVPLGAASYGVGLLLFGAVTIGEIRSLVASFLSRRQAVHQSID